MTRSAGIDSGAPEDAPEERIDVTQVMVEVERAIDLLRRERPGDVRVSLQEILEGGLAGAGLHRRRLHPGVRLLAGDPFLRELQENRTGKDQPAGRFEVAAHDV